MRGATAQNRNGDLQFFLTHCLSLNLHNINPPHRYVTVQFISVLFNQPFFCFIHVKYDLHVDIIRGGDGGDLCSELLKQH